jgi:hypothetical protein
MEERLDNITQEIIGIFHHLDLFKKLGEIWDKNETLKKMDSTLLVWMKRAFTTDLIMSIGRVCDKDSRTNSLAMFLKDLKDNKQYLTREKYISHYDASNSFLLRIANKDFDALAGEKKSVYPGEKIDEDIERLTEREPCKKILSYRNQYVAHSDRAKDESLPTYDDLFKSFEVIEEIANKYNSLVLGKGYVNLTPTMQGNWADVLTVPWIEKDW